jgi:PAS domain S-box-containing protein
MWPAEFVSENITRLGYEVEDFTSNRLLYGDIVHPEDLEKMAAELKMHVEEGCLDYTSEYRILTKSGEVRWVDERTVVQRNQEGEVHLQGIILDITEHKKAGIRFFRWKKSGKKKSITVLKTICKLFPLFYTWSQGILRTKM